MADDEHAGAAGLSFSDEMSLEWQPVERLPDDARLAMINESNEGFLRAVSVIGAFTGEFSEDEMSVPQEIARLDLKLNLLLDLVSQLIYQQTSIPERRLVTVSAHEIAWRDDNPPSLGDILLMRVYLQHGTPKPLCFYGEVLAAQGDDSNSQTHVRYVGLSSSVQSWLDKLIFRHHRREVAFRRRGRSTD